MRAADLIGQLGDPHYLRKANALYYEFEEVGMNRQLGYTSPADLTDRYPQFTGTAFQNTSKPRSVTSMSALADDSGLQAFTAMYFARSAISGYAARSDEQGPPSSGPSLVVCATF